MPPPEDPSSIILPGPSTRDTEGKEHQRAHVPSDAPGNGGGEEMAAEEWDCRNCPVAADLLRWLDELSARCAGLEFRNRRLREKLADKVSR